MSASGAPSFVVDTPYANYLPVFWEGRNDFGLAAQILSDLAGQVATVPPGQDYLVLSVINENRPQEWYGVSGNDLYQWVIPFNEQLGSIYGSHYIDVRKLLVDAYDPTQATDVTDYQHDEPPSSLRAVDQTATLANSIGPNDTSITLANESGIPGVSFDCEDRQRSQCGKHSGHRGFRQNIDRNPRLWRKSDLARRRRADRASTTMVHLNAKGYQVVANAVATILIRVRTK